jgi:hypothetical protein
MAGFTDQLKTAKRNIRKNKIAFFIKILLHLYGFLSSSEEKNLLLQFCGHNYNTPNFKCQELLEIF